MMARTASYTMLLIFTCITTTCGAGAQSLDFGGRDPAEVSFDFGRLRVTPQQPGLEMADLPNRGGAQSFDFAERDPGHLSQDFERGRFTALPPGLVMPGLPTGEPERVDWYSAGASGAQRRDTSVTGAQAWQDFTPGNVTAFPGQTFTTGPGTINAGDLNGPLLPATTTGEIGLQSPLYKPIPSGYYTHGFDMRYCHCDTHLPPTSTSSIDFNIVDQ